MNLPINDQQKMNEIIFANRNKRYGAYAIRSSYNSTLLRALFIISSTVLIFGLTARILTKSHDSSPLNVNQILPELTKTITVNMDQEKQQNSKPSERRTTKSTLPTSNNNSQVNRVVDSLPEIKQPDPLNNQLANATGSTSTNGPETPGDPQGGNGGGSQGSGGGNNLAAEPNPAPDESPEFEGGLAALRSFLAKNISYPTIARDLGTEGTVYVSFVIDETGQVGGIKILKGIGSGCDEEASRVVSKIPKFKKPGKVGGQPVKTLYNLPIAFKLR